MASYYASNAIPQLLLKWMEKEEDFLFLFKSLGLC